MLDVQEIIRRNPKAASDLETVRDVIELMRKLREAGLAKSEVSKPTVRRPSIDGLKMKGAYRHRLRLRELKV